MVIACLVDVHERLTNLPSEQHQAYQWVNAKTLLQMPDVHENTKAYFQVAPKQLIFGNTLSYLMEGGLPEEEEEIAVKRNLALQIKEMMGSQNLSIFEMARRMHTSRATLERLLDPENRSVTLNTMDKAARSLGKRLQLVLS
jgi:predicted XRE-type DNA-binding protein